MRVWQTVSSALSVLLVHEEASISKSISHVQLHIPKSEFGFRVFWVFAKEKIASVLLVTCEVGLASE